MFDPKELAEKAREYAYGRGAVFFDCRELVAVAQCLEELAELRERVERHLTATGACEWSAENSTLCDEPNCTYCELERTLLKLPRPAPTEQKGGDDD